VDQTGAYDLLDALEEHAPAHRASSVTSQSSGDIATSPLDFTKSSRGKAPPSTSEQDDCIVEGEINRSGSPSVPQVPAPAQISPEPASAKSAADQPIDAGGSNSTSPERPSESVHVCEIREPCGCGSFGPEHRPHPGCEEHSPQRVLLLDEGKTDTIDHALHCLTNAQKKKCSPLMSSSTWLSPCLCT
jgi:hypothetical protein